MTDELESRLSDGLSRHAAGLPIYEGDLQRVTRRGRRRRVAARGAGAFGALVLLGGGIALVSAAREGEPSQLATEETDGVPVIIEDATPTPPEPTPAPTPEQELETDEATPEPAATPNQETAVRNIFAVTATGWGSGLVGSSGEFFASLVCCEDQDLDWRSQAGEEPSLGALRVRDDLAGGLIASSVDTLWWVPAADLGSGSAPMMIDTRVSPDSSVRLDLWDVAVIDDTTTILYSYVDQVSGETDDGEPFAEGRAQLLEATIIDGEIASFGDEVTSVEWTTDGRDDAYLWTGAAFLAEGGHMEVRSRLDGSCEWMTFADGLDLYESPSSAPEPGGDCPQASIGGATVNGDGQVAVIERYLSEPPLTAQLVVYDRQANPLGRWDLPPTEEGQGRWTEVDMVGSTVLVSRDATDDLAADDVRSINVNADPPADPFRLPFTGNPSLARSNITTDSLASVASDSPLWFGAGGVIADPDPEPEPTPDPDIAPTPVAEPTPDPEPAPETIVRKEFRKPVGPGGNIVAADSGSVTDGCLGAVVCLGAPIDEALTALTDVWGDEDSDSPEAFREGEPPPPEEHLFITPTSDIWVIEQEGLVSGIRSWPNFGEPVGDVEVLGNVVEALGPPSEIFLGGGEGNDVLWVFYETEVAYVGFGFVESWGTDDPRLTEDVVDGLPVAYDFLPVNAYWIQQPRPTS